MGGDLHDNAVRKVSKAIERNKPSGRECGINRLDSFRDDRDMLNGEGVRLVAVVQQAI